MTNKVYDKNYDKHYDKSYKKNTTCVMRKTYSGYPCNDYQCSACGKIHNAPRVNNYCPRCGAKVVRVEDITK